MTDRLHSLPSRLLFLIFLLGCVSPAPARSDEPHWIRINSSHFSVLTDAEEKRGREVVVRFEQMRAVFGQLLARSRINMSEPVDIIALRSDEEYSKAVPTRPGQSIAAGFFIPGDDRNYFVLNLSKDESWRAVSREFAKVFLNYNYPPTQAWFDEGFAEYFSSLRFENRQAQIGGDPDLLADQLKASAWLTISDLFAKTSAGQENSRRTMFSAQSWIVMHYLLAQNKLPETGTYFDLVENHKVSVEDAIQKAYGMNSAQFGQAVKDYFRSLAQPAQASERGKANPAGSQVLAVSADDQIGSSTQQLASAEGPALVAEMSVRLPEHREQATHELESIIAQPKADNVVAHRALGWLYMETKEYNRAVEELDKSAQLDAKDPWLHYYLALVRFRVAQSTGKEIEGLPNAMQDLRLVTDWDPEFAEARSMLAMAQLEGGGVHAAMDSMRAILQFAPRNQSYLLNMAQIYMAGKNWDAATALLERLKESPQPQIAKSATEQLEGLPMLKKYGLLPPRESKAQSTQAGSAPSSSPTPATSSAGSSSSGSKQTETQPRAQKENPPPEEEPSADHPEQLPAQPQPDKRTIQFAKGKIISVDCSQPPSAVLTVSVGAKVLKLRTANYKSLMVMGADDFSCDWKSRAVAVNYRAGGKADGDLVSVEVQ